MQFVALTTVACCSLLKVIPVLIGYLLILIYTVWETFKGVLKIFEPENLIFYSQTAMKNFFSMSKNFLKVIYIVADLLTRP
jgi:hypothetical protein